MLNLIKTIRENKGKQGKIIIGNSEKILRDCIIFYAILLLLLLL